MAGPEGKAFVVPGGENGIGEARFFRGPDPFVRIIIFRVEFPGHGPVFIGTEIRASFVYLLIIFFANDPKYFSRIDFSRLRTPANNHWPRSVEVFYGRESPVNEETQSCV